MAKKVVFIVAFEGYNSIEYETPKKMLEKEGIKVVTASTKLGHALSSDGKTIKIDQIVSQLQPEHYDGLVVIGGSGTHGLYNDAVYEAIQNFNMAGKVIGGICHGTRVLAKAGALVSRNATGWNEDAQLEELYREHGVIYQDDPVLIDAMERRIVTAKGPREAEAFGQALLEVL